ncbi:YbaK/EbsC family protein [Clostridium sp. AM58-1XD]|uniref:YbaK/EbsC family protein n=1 Tax=Clostridium sp. AM58-1XD TaxID=2292307 RepID=UPI00268BC72A
MEPARIAKTMSFCTKEEGGCILVVTAGDMKIDNSKFKGTFGFKAKMPKGEEVEALTGHAIGGVCPFANPEHVTVYLDESLKRFTTVFPAAGSGSSAIELTCGELEALSHAASWVDVCKNVCS